MLRQVRDQQGDVNIVISDGFIVTLFIRYGETNGNMPLFVNEGDGCKQPPHHENKCVCATVSEINACINRRCLPLGFDIQDMFNLYVFESYIKILWH